VFQRMAGRDREYGRKRDCKRETEGGNENLLMEKTKKGWSGQLIKTQKSFRIVCRGHVKLEAKRHTNNNKRGEEV